MAWLSVFILLSLLTGSGVYIIVQKKRLSEQYCTASIDFYDSGFDLKYSFGKASVKFYSKGLYTRLLGFHDRYDFDSKPWGTRSMSAELITRGYNSAVNGTPFEIYYRKCLFAK